MRGPSPKSNSTFTQSLLRPSGGSGSEFASSGSKVRGAKSGVSGNATGSIDSGNATGRPSLSYTMGNGSPQYRCRENNQSRNRYVTVPEPAPRSSSHAMIVCFASSTLIPSNDTSSLWELMTAPSPVHARSSPNPPAEPRCTPRPSQRLSQKQSHGHLHQGQP